MRDESHEADRELGHHDAKHDPEQQGDEEI
jgi:hypothetical protein